MSVSNPNGANQYQLDSRQKLCWESYINPKSETFGNAKQSAIKAGYVEDYADQITTSEWFLGKLRRLNMLSKAEKVLSDMLDMPIEIVDRFGNKAEANEEDDAKELVTKTEPALVKIKQDTAKFLAERLGKQDYSIRSELTGANGETLEVNVINYKDNNDPAQLPTEGLPIELPTVTDAIQDIDSSQARREEQNSTERTDSESGQN